jgi:putative sigma-54 modulation protein
MPRPAWRLTSPARVAGAPPAASRRFAVQLSVTGRHLDITDTMREYVEDKLRKLDRFYDRIEAVDVVLDHESLKYRIEVVVRADHKHTFVAQVDASDFYEAVDLVVDKLGRQLTRHKERFRNRKHPEAAAEEGALEGGV